MAEKGYIYDIFISYNRDKIDWVQEVFLPEFKKYLIEAYQEEPKIFIDEQEISVGDSWPNRLKKALAHSKCMVGIWSPSYFKSPWCLRECAVMFFREKKLGYRTTDNPCGLVLPIRIHDGVNFPGYAQDIEYLDCRRYWRSPLVLKKSDRYMDFQDQIIEWTEDVAAALKKSPKWQEIYLSDEWLDQPMKQFEKPEKIVFKAPTLG